MDFDVSDKTVKICKAFKLSAETLAFADLCSLGWEPVDAYIVAFRKGSTWIKRALKDEVKKLFESEAVQNRIAENRKVLTERQKEAVKQTAKKERNAIVDVAMSKEQMLFDLQTAAATKPQGSKEWIELKKLIIEVTRMKQEDVKQEDSTIVYHLPVHYPTGCKDCLYQRCDSCKYKKEVLEGQKKEGMS